MDSSLLFSKFLLQLGFVELIVLDQSEEVFGLCFKLFELRFKRLQLLLFLGLELSALFFPSDELVDVFIELSQRLIFG